MPGLADKTEALAAIIRQWCDYHPNVGVSFQIVSKGVFVTVLEDQLPAFLRRKDTIAEAMQAVIHYIKHRDDPVGAPPRSAA